MNTVECFEQYFLEYFYCLSFGTSETQAESIPTLYDVISKHTSKQHYET